MNASQPPRSNTSGPGFIAFTVSVISILFPLPGLVDLYSLPAGATCRPMGMAMVLFIFGVVSPLLAIVTGMLSLFVGRASRRLGIVAILLSLVPLPLYVFLIQWIVASHHLILES